MSDEDQSLNLPRVRVNLEMKPARLTLHPQQFRGGSDEDAERHLTQFMRVARVNCWDNDWKLLYFPQFLEGTAKIWFDTWEIKHKPTTWNELVLSFRDAFKSIGSEKLAIQRLRERVQKANESPEDFVYSIVELCQAVDSAMTESRVVSILLEKMSNDYMRVINQTHPETVEDVLREMRTYAESEMMRRYKYTDEVLTIDKLKIQESTSESEFESDGYTTPESE